MSIEIIKGIALGGPDLDTQCFVPDEYKILKLFLYPHVPGETNPESKQRSLNDQLLIPDKTQNIILYLDTWFNPELHHPV